MTWWGLLLSFCSASRSFQQLPRSYHQPLRASVPGPSCSWVRTPSRGGCSAGGLSPQTASCTLHIENCSLYCSAELEKAGSTGFAEHNFFRFSAISVLFSAIFFPNHSKFDQISPNFTKVYKSLHNLPNFTKFLPNFTKFYQINVQISDLRNFVAI